MKLRLTLHMKLLEHNELIEENTNNCHNLAESLGCYNEFISSTLLMYSSMTSKLWCFEVYT